jgi:ABC-type antimicrobial peptide transport system permease subunit
MAGVALKSSFKQRASNVNFRKGLVVFQFAISVTMIVATVGVFLQLKHIRTLHLGLEREGLVFVPREGALKDRVDMVTYELLNRPGISGVTVSGQNPLNVGNNTTSVGWLGKPRDTSPIFFVVNAGYDYVGTMGMQLADGRDFSRAHHDSTSYLLNEAAAQLMGGDMLGKKIKVYGDEGEIVGVVKNFSMNSLYSSVSPTVIHFAPESSGRLYVRTQAEQVTEALANLKAVCEQFNPGYPFEYEFLDQVFEQTYRSEAVMGTLANIFAIISVIISCLGLWGLAAFTFEQRTKEVGIRKVMGASAAGLAAYIPQILSNWYLPESLSHYQWLVIL